MVIKIKSKISVGYKINQSKLANSRLILFYLVLILVAAMKLIKADKRRKTKGRNLKYVKWTRY